MDEDRIEGAARNFGGKSRMLLAPSPVTRLPRRAVKRTGRRAPRRRLMDRLSTVSGALRLSNPSWPFCPRWASGSSLAYC